MDVPSELVNFIKTGSNFVIAGHIEPDGDCIGSQLALCSVLERMGKNAIVCSAGPFVRANIKKIEDRFSAGQLNNLKADTRVIIVDCSSLKRTGNIHEKLEKFPFAVIDHHASSNYSTSASQDPVYVDSSAPSCTIMIERIITALEMELTKEEAEYLLFGLCTDTGFFRHLTEKNADIFEAASRMIKAGASPKHCFNLMNGGKSLDSRILIGHILCKTESFFNGKFLLSYETLEDHKNFGLENRDSDALNQLLLSIEGVEAIAVIRQEEENTCNVSFRSIDKIDVSKIAVSFGGGGHKNASGFTTKGNYTEVKKIILESFTKIFS